MGIQDFVNVFDNLDATQRGFVTLDQLADFHESVYLTPVRYNHLESAVQSVCGPDHCGKVKKDEFLEVLEEVARRQSLDEQAYWDFQAFDFNGSHRIKLQDALTLFQEYHGDLFSLHTWHQFLQSRLDPASDIYFDEIRDWLCNPQGGEPATDTEVQQELSEIEQSRWDHFRQEYDALKVLKEGDQDEGDDQYAEDTQRNANRKLQKWNREGLAAMLTDDGLDAEGDDTLTTTRKRDAVSATDLLDAMEAKYSMLIDALASHMAAFAANMDSEKQELVQQIKRSVTKLTKDGKIKSVDSLPGSTALLPLTLLRMMGSVQPGHLRHQSELGLLRQKLQGDGKSAQETDELLKKEYHFWLNGPLDSGQALADLMQRKVAEKEWLLAVARGQAEGNAAAWLELCRLQRQLIILKELSQILPAAIAVGLAERPQVYQCQVYDSDRERSEVLAKERLLERQGHAVIRTSSQLPDIVQLQKSGGVNIRANIVAELELRLHLEREALIFMLQGPGSEQKKVAGQKMSEEDRQKRLTTLRSHHLNWKMGNSGDSAPNFTLLEEAVGVYWAKRQSEIEKQQHNVLDSAVNAAVLADLQQRQEVEFAQCLDSMAGKKGEELISVLKQESRPRLQEHFNNIAFVVLGAVDITKEDQEYLDALIEKYRAVRDQIFVFALKDKHGHGGWNNLGREGRQSELLKLRKEEKKLRGDFHLMEMASIIGSKSQALPALVILVGENKGYGKAPVSTPVTTKPKNLLADLVPRFDLEQETLLSWLHSDDFKSKEGLEQKLRELVSLEMERFVVGVDGDFEAGLTALGLLERIQWVSGGRSKADKEKQRKLAVKRVALRKLRTRQGEPYKSPAEDKMAPTPGDKLSWQRAVPRSILRRQAVERELLLRVLQDSGFGDLVEAAGLMVVEERWQRLSYLSEKHQGLNLTTADGREEHLSILEEAAALRVVGVRALARQQMGRAMTEDEVSAALLTELQDLHDTELSDWLLNGLHLEENLLQQRLDLEKRSREEEHAGSVLTVLTRVDGGSEVTDIFIKILDEKYAALREAMMLSSVMHHGGERLSQKQRDKQLQSLRKEVVPLWDTGDAEQVAKGLGPGFVFEHPVAWLIGMERSKFAKERDAAETGQCITEPESSEDTGSLSAVKHLMHRYAEEKEFLLSSLAGANGQFLSENMKTALKSRLRRERDVTATEGSLVFAALTCGLVERQTEDISAPQLEKDKERYQLLGKHEFNTRQSGREGRQKKDSLTVDRQENREALQDAVLNLLQKKHLEERQLLAEMLINARFETIQRETALESHQQRNDRLALLKSKRQSSTLESSSDNLALLQEALVVYREIKRGHVEQGSPCADDLSLNCEMMAAVLLLQNTEAEQYLGDFATEELSDLIESQEQILEEFRKNHCISIAALVFSPDVFKKGGETVDPLMEALDGKYDALRDKLLMEALINQIGEKNWHNMSERERQRRLMELKLKERQLRRDGKYDELAALLGDALNNEATLNKLLGENREDHERKVRERLEKRKQRRAEGMSEEECDRLEKEEEEQEEEEARQRRRNVLHDLQHNFDQEREALLRQLQEGSDDPDRERQKRLLQLKLEQRRLRRDDDVHSTALLLHQHDQMVKDREDERRRQEHLARERLEAARLRKQEGRKQTDDGQLSIIATELETEEDCSKLQEMALTSLDLKHQSEREFLIMLLEEHSTGQQREEAKSMSLDDLTRRQEELREVYQLLREKSKAYNMLDDGGMELFQEAISCALELKKYELKSEGKSSLEEDLHIALLADLQQVHEDENSSTMASVIDMDAVRLKQLTRSIIKMKEDGSHGNVAQVILHSEKPFDGDGPDEDEMNGLTEEEKEEKRVVKALEMKYDALRDKLIIEALMKQYGEVEWKRMSELERQRKVSELKRQERRLRHEGKMDEVEALLGQHLKHKQDLESVFGESKEEQKRRLEERLARRRQLKAEREAEGLSADDAILDAIQEGEEEKETVKQKNVLENLQMHFEDEKAALLAGLNQHADATERERQRQHALVKLQRERQRLQAEDKLDSAALIFSMAKQQHEDHQDSLLKERDRQRQLARERLMQRKRQVLEGKEGPPGEQNSLQVNEEDIPENAFTNDLQPLQEGTLLAMDKHQSAERDTLLQLLAKCRRDKERAKQLKTMSDEELRLKLTKAEKEHAMWRKESAKKVAALADPHLSVKRRNKLMQKAAQRFQSQLDILGQALAHKLELESRQLQKLRPDSKEGELWEELCVITLADLQERQMMLFNSVQESIFTKSKEELESLRKAQRAANREGWFDSLSALSFSVEDMSAEGASASDCRAAEAKLQEEFMQQKQAILEKANKEGIDADAMLRDLEDQFAAKKKKFNEDMERQRTDLQQRLDARRRQQTDRSFEAEAVVQMLKQAESQSQAAHDRATAERGNQKSLLQERLQQRREARKRAALTSREDSTLTPRVDDIPRSDSVSTVSSLGMRREKTIIDTTVSEDQKQAIYNQLVKQQLKEQYSKTAQREKQEEELKRRLEARKGKREDEAAALFSLGERQKTFLEQAKRGEQERQIAQMRERVSRVKHERTRTKRPRRRSSSSDPAFADQALREGDEVMEEKARKLQEQFTQQSQMATVSQERPSTITEDAPQVSIEKSRMDILKERRLQKKLQRQGEQD